MKMRKRKAPDTMANPLTYTLNQRVLGSNPSVSTIFSETYVKDKPAGGTPYGPQASDRHQAVLVGDYVTATD